jgi:hypothetical protein
MAKLKQREGEEPEVDETEEETEEREPKAASEDGDEYDLEPPPKTESDDDEGEPAPERKPRSERRKERGKVIEQLRAAEAERAQWQQERSQMAERLAHMEGRLSKQEKPEADPLDAKIDDVKARRRALTESFNNLRAASAAAKVEMDPAKVAEMQRQAEALDEELIEHRAEKVLKTRMGGNIPRPVTPQQQRAQAAMQAVRQRYPDVAMNENAFGYALTTYQAHMRVPGFVDSFESMDDVMEEARARFRIGPQNTKPTKNTRDMFTSSPRSAGAGGGNGGGPVKYKPVDADYKMAEKIYPHIKDERQRMQKYITEKVAPAMKKKAAADAAGNR